MRLALWVMSLIVPAFRERLHRPSTEALLYAMAFRRSLAPSPPPPTPPLLQTELPPPPSVPTLMPRPPLIRLADSALAVGAVVAAAAADVGAAEVSGVGHLSG